MHRFTLTFVAIFTLFLPSLAMAVGVALPKTGQTASYATGDDGNLKKGVAWPSPRFTSNANGTVTDNLTGLVWLKKVDCFPVQTWTNALSSVSGLASGACGLTDGSAAGDWRIPNRRELLSLIDFSRNNPALPSGHPFTGVAPGNYWTSSSYAGNQTRFIISLVYGYIDRGSTTYAVWPVRDGNWTVPQQFSLTVGKSGTGNGSVTPSSGSLAWNNSSGTASYYSGTQVTLTAAPASGSAFVGWSGACGGTGPCTVTMSAAKSVNAIFALSDGGCSAAAPVRKTGQTVSFVSGDDGDLQKGVAMPAPRYTEIGDGTVADNLTGLIWAQDESTPTVETCIGGNLTWQQAHDYVACLNSISYLGHNDWLLPNINELRSRAGSYPNGYPFSGTGGIFISSTTVASDTATAWYIDNNVPRKLSKTTSSSGIRVVPLREGKWPVFALGIPKTGQTTSLASGDDGNKQRGVAWPSSRFSDNNNGTVTDNLTGLTWLKNANCYTTSWPGLVTWTNSLASGQCGLSDASVAGNWRLANVEELLSLVDYSSAAPNVLPANHPFLNVRSDYSYWSSSASNTSNYYWSVNLKDGLPLDNVYSYGYTAWPVRGGPIYVYPLTVSQSGNGSGSIVPSSGSLTWSGTTGTASYSDITTVTLTAKPASGSTFAGWSGACSGTAPCTVTMNAAKNVTATFVSNDITAPTGTIKIAAGAAVTNASAVTLTLTGAGTPTQMRFSNDNSTWSDWQSFATSKSGWALDDTADGLKTVYLQLRDAVGNVSASFNDTILYDTTKPTGTVLIKGSEPSNTYSKSAAVTLQLTKDELSATQLRYRTYNGSLWSAWSTYAAYPASNTLTVSLAAGEGFRGVEVQFKDAVGNESDLASPISDDILLDTVVPTGSLLVNGGVALGNSLDLTLTLAANDAGSGIESMQVSTSSLFAGANWEPFAAEKTYTLPLPQADGLKTVYVRYRDEAGNQSPAYSKNVTLDRTAPTGTIKIAAGAAVTSASTVTLTLTGAGTPIQMRFSNDNSTWSDWQAYATSKTGWVLSPGDGVKTVYLQLQDAIGNISASFSDTILYDTTRPAGTVLIKGSEPSNTYSKSATVTLQLTKDELSATQLRYRTYNGSLWSAWSTYAAYPASNTMTVNLAAGNGPRSVEVQFKDAVGNESELSTPISDDIQLDTIVPTGSLLVNGGATLGNSLDLTLTLAANDAGSGIESMQVSTSSLFAGANWEPFAPEKTYTLPLPQADGLKTVYVRYRDAAGNLSPAYSKSVTLDRTAPTGTPKIAAGAAVTSASTVTLTLTGAGTPIQMRFSNDNSTWSDWQAYATSKTGWVLSPDDGVKTVYLQLQDAVGNISASFSDTILYDTTKPTGTVLIKGSEPSNTYSKSATVTLQLTKDELSATQLRYRTYNGSLWSAWSTYAAYPASNTLAVNLAAGNGLRSVEIQYKDAVGNESDLAVPISDEILLDTLLPTGSLLVNGGLLHSNSLDLTLTLAANDADSGIESMQVSTNSLFTGANWEPLAAEKAFTLPLPQADGLKTVYVRYRDVAGNISPTYKQSFTLDRTAPTGTIKIAAGAVATSASTVTLTLTGAGTPDQMRFSNDNSTWSDWQWFATNAEWNLSPDDGVKTVYMQLQDVNGNVSASFSDTILYDTTAQIVTVLIKGSEPSNTYTRSSTVTLQLTKDDESPLQINYRIHNGLTWTTWSQFVNYPASGTLSVTLPPGNGTYTVEVQYKDAAQILWTPISDSIIVDTVAPVMESGHKFFVNFDAWMVQYSSDNIGGEILVLNVNVPMPPVEMTSGMAAILWSHDRLTWTEMPWVEGNYTIHYPMKTPTANVTKTVYLKLKDKAGNLSPIYTDSIIVSTHGL